MQTSRASMIVSPHADSGIPAGSAAQLEGAKIRIATSDYLNRPLRNQKQVWMDYQYRKTA